MSSNKSAKEKLIQLYGAECFIEKLHLRHDTGRTYKSKGQRKRMKQLTYHHIIEKSKGGKATVENGALLSAENHQWFNQQPKEKQEEMNRQFQQYKLGVVVLGGESKELDFDLSEDYIEIKVQKFNRAREKRDTRKALSEYYTDEYYTDEYYTDEYEEGR